MSPQLRSHIPFVLASLFVFCLSVNSVSAGTRIQASDLTFLGTISITHSDGGCANTPNARETGLTYNPSGNGGAGSFYIPGRQGTHCVAEITKPAVGGMATFIQNYTDPTGGTANQIGDCYNGCFMGGQLIYNNNLYLTAFSYYDAAFTANKSIWRHNLTLSNQSGRVGPVAAGPGNQGTYNQYMDNVPSAFQSMLGGPAVIGGCCFSIISRTSLGPALYAFDPENLGTVVPLVGYPDGHQTLNAWGASGAHPEANPTTKMGAVSFVEGTDTVLFVGTTGKGQYCYGGSECNDPQYPDTKGAHAYPYVHYMWAYDVNDLAQVKSGAKQMWDVLPYAMWEMPSLGDVSDEWSAIGMAFDSANSRLYILKSRENGAAWPQMYVYNVNATPDTTPPTSPTSLSATSPSQSSITVSWTAATDNIAVTNYQVERCLGLSCSNFTQVGTPTTSPFTDTGLTASTGYSYHVRAVDAAGNVSGWSNVVGATTQAPDTTSPSTPTILQASASSSSTIDLTWTASTDNIAVTQYKLERCQGSSCTTFTQIGTPTTNSYSDSGLTASTTYRYRVRATDAAGNNSSYSSIAQASTPQAPPSPTFVSEYETPWNTSSSPKTTSNFSVQSGDTLVAYAVNEDGGQALSTPPAGTLQGTWTLQQSQTAGSYTGLRLWTMQVSSNQTNVNVSFSNGGNTFGGDVLHFRNTSGIGVTAQANNSTGNPSLTLTNVQENSTIVMVNGDWSAKTGTRTYNTTSAGSFTETSYYADGSSYGVEAGYYANAGTAGNKTIGLTAPTGMKWAIAGVEVKGSGSSGSGDTTPPTSPTNLAANATSSSSITVSWAAATDNVGVVRYDIERCTGLSCSTFAQVGTASNSPFTDTGLTASTGYSYHVRAVDAAGNTSGWSNVVGATTQSGSGSGTACNTVNVGTATQLTNAVNTANSNASCSTTILVADGTYTLSAMLAITAPNMTVKGSSGDRTKVILQGDAMSSTANVKEIFYVNANNFTIENMTLQRVGWHTVQVVGENNRDNFVARNMVFRDAYEQIIKISQDVNNPNVTGDNGLIENSLFEYTAGIGPEYYIGGIDIHGGSNWIIRGNTFKNIISPDTAVAEHAVHIWDAPASNNLVEKNLIINCDRGIGFGLGDRGNSGGIIRNNMIYHAAGNGSFVDVPIGLETSPNTQVYNNTIYLANNYPNAIEYRFTATTGVTVKNNLANKAVLARDGATGTASNNITNAQSSWFTNVSQGDLHLANGTTSANNAGTTVSGLTDDYDGNTRPQGGGIDIGADEYVTSSTFSSCSTITPTNFTDPTFTGYGAPYDVFASNTPLISTQCSSADTHTLTATLGIPGDTTRIVYTKGYYYDPGINDWTSFTGTCTGALNGEWCQGSVATSITDTDISTASVSDPSYLVGFTCRSQNGSWKCGCRDTACANFYWQVQGGGM